MTSRTARQLERRGFLSGRFFRGEHRVDEVAEGAQALVHVMHIDLYVIYKACACDAYGSGCKRAKHGFGSATREGASRLCLASALVAEPKSCFARLRQSPEPDVKNLI